MTAAEFLRAVEARAAAATGGPWRAGRYGGSVVAEVGSTNPCSYNDDANNEAYGGMLIGESMTDHNATFIASAPDDVRKMAAALLAVLAVCASNEAYTDWDDAREYLAIDVIKVTDAIEGILAPLPTAPCRRCKHQPSDHFEDGTDEAPTACAVVFGDWACSCAGYLVEAGL